MDSLSLSSTAAEITKNAHDGNKLIDGLKFVERMKLDKGYISPYFVTDQKTQVCDLDDPLILIHEKKILSINTIVNILELAMNKKRHVLIAADDVKSDALATLTLNKVRAGLIVCAIKAPGFGVEKKSNLENIAVLTGGQVITVDLGLVNVNGAQLNMIGSCKKVIISDVETVILDGACKVKSIEDGCEKAIIQSLDQHKIFGNDGVSARGMSSLEVPCATSNISVSRKEELCNFYEKDDDQATHDLSNLIGSKVFDECSAEQSLTDNIDDAKFVIAI